jgi:hypothetical protein
MLTQRIKLKIDLVSIQSILNNNTQVYAVDIIMP